MTNMTKPIIFMFSGQGSQFFHMGRDLFSEHPVFRKWMITLDEIVREKTGESVLDVLYNENRRRSDTFDQIFYSHSAIFMVEFALAQVLLDSGIEADYVLGTSLGEFASAALAGVMEVEDLLSLVVKQAEYLQTHCEKGRMLAIIHDVALYKESSLIIENSELAAVNYNAHFVVSGTSIGINRIERYLKSRNILYQPLPISYGFHSSAIDAASSAYIEYLNSKSYRLPQIPFVSCAFGTILRKIPDCFLWDVIRKPIQFSKVVRELGGKRNYIYLDIGPGGTLANFVKRNMDVSSSSEYHAILTPFSHEMKSLEVVQRLYGRKSY